VSSVFFSISFVSICYCLNCFRYKLPFYLQEVKILSCFLFEYNRLLDVFVPCRLRTSFHLFTGHLIQTIRMILYQTDVVKARQSIFFLFWQHQNASYLFIANWISNGDILFFAIPAPMDRSFSRATIHMIEYWFFCVFPRLDMFYSFLFICF